jgi:cytochrome c oxidase cbb3-type subunit 3
MRLTIGITCAAALLIGSVAGHLARAERAARNSGFGCCTARPAGKAAAGEAAPAEARGEDSLRSSERSPTRPTRDRGKLLYEINCRSCHGADLRGGETGGPNLLARSSRLPICTAS